jgi:hypothetical protein
LNSHPCEPTVLRRFPNTPLILHERFEGHKQRWARDNAKVQVVCDKHFLVWNLVETEPLYIVSK